MEMKLYEAEFEGMYPVGNHLFIWARTLDEAIEIAQKTVTHTKVEGVCEVSVPSEPCVLSYASGDY